MDQPGKIANPVRGQPNREKYTKYIHIFLYSFAPENLVSRDGFCRRSRSALTRSFSTPRLNHQSSITNHQSSIINHQSGAYSRNSSPFPRRYLFFKPPSAIASIPRLSGHAINCVPMAFTAESPPAQGHY